MKVEFSTPRQLSFRSQRQAQGLWVFNTLLAVVFFLFEVYRFNNSVFSTSSSLEENLDWLGVNLQAYAIYLTMLRSFYMSVCLVIAGILIFKSPNELMAVFAAFFLVILGTCFWPLSEGMANQPDLWQLPRAVANLAMSSSLLIFFLIFPDGRFIPRWTRFFAAAMFILLVGENFAPESLLNPRTWGPLAAALLSLLTVAVLVFVPVYRYRKVSNPVIRQQTKWVVYGISAAIIGFFIVSLPAAFGLSMDQGKLYGLILVTSTMLLLLLIPVSIGIAITRSRLWDIDPIINRSLVYGALSLLTILLYVVLVGGFAFLFNSYETNIVVSFIATGIVAILFEPLRQRLQRAVNRLMYGERDDPATVLTRLSQRLESALAPDSILETIVETLAQTLRLPYAAISLSDDAHIAFGREMPDSELIHLPLTYHTDRVGELILAPRAPGEFFSPADMKLINLIAQQAGVAAYMVHLNNALQKSRERLVAAQEEERRRLRRDLHDGVGPTLASLSLRIDTAVVYVRSDPEKAMELLKELKGQVKETVAEIRRLVYALRPPVLDEFGLVSAIREHVAQYMGPGNMRIDIDALEPLPPLPAAVEVAAYRIALEAFTNVVKHSRASACQIKIKLESDCLLLEVSDNGRGIPSGTHGGIGFNSMRERAAELGGECTIGNHPDGGTQVFARLPVGKE